MYCNWRAPSHKKKSRIFIKITSLFFTLIWMLPTTAAEEKILNIYNWANYMPKQVLKKFSKQTGIHINYSEFDSNETLYAKLKSNPNIGYDLVVPSNYYIPRMIREHLIQPINLNRIPNYRWIKPYLLHRHFDPKNRFSIPYSWGITGIAVNRRYHPNDTINRWQDFWRPQYRNQLLILNDMRGAFNIALITLGYSINDKNKAHIYQAYLKLKALMPNIKLFNSDAEQNIYVDADATIGMGWNGDIYQAQQENKNIDFIFVKDHFILWIDSFVLCENAPHPNNAHLFLNFINQPEIAAEIALYNGYSSPNNGAIARLPKAQRDNPTFNPPMQLLKRAELEEDVGEAIQWYQKYWYQLKLLG